jgi:hypothetical protein
MMGGQRGQPADPVIAEVRQWRSRMFAKAGGSLAGLVDLLRGTQAVRSPGNADSKRRQSTRKKPA